MQFYISNHWSIFFYHDKVLILKCSLFLLSNADTEIWSKEKSMAPYVAKMFFYQGDEGFWL